MLSTQGCLRLSVSGHGGSLWTGVHLVLRILQRLLLSPRSKAQSTPPLLLSSVLRSPDSDLVFLLLYRVLISLLVSVLSPRRVSQYMHYNKRLHVDVAVRFIVLCRFLMHGIASSLTMSGDQWTAPGQLAVWMGIINSTSISSHSGGCCCCCCYFLPC